MEEHRRFYKKIDDAASEFRSSVGKTKPVRVISHLDADGTAAAAIIIKALIREGMNYSITIVPQLKEDILKSVADEEYDIYIFTDLGAGQIQNIKKHLSKKKVFILDHHTPNGEESYENIVHVNPHFFGIKGDSEISGAGVVFLFSKALNEKNSDMAHIAIVGAIGDVQEKNGFKPLNNDIVEIAIKQKKIERKKSLRFFGVETKPIYKLIAYGTEVIIPGVTGSESRAIQFLNDIGIAPQVDKRWKKLSNLTDSEMQTLVSSIIIKRQNEDDPSDVLGFVYKLIDEEEGSPMRDAKEFSTMLNACGRLNKSSIGIGACLGDKKSKQEAIRTINEYKKEILNAFKWYDENKNSDRIIHEKGFIIIDAKDNILGTIIGTLASMISHQEGIAPGTYILGVAKTSDGTVKASLRISGKSKEGTDLKGVVDEIVSISGGESGGHSVAAGASVPLELEGEFLNAARRVLSRKVLEEIIR